MVGRYFFRHSQPEMIESQQKTSKALTDFRVTRWKFVGRLFERCLVVYVPSPNTSL